MYLKKIWEFHLSNMSHIITHNNTHYCLMRAITGNYPVIQSIWTKDEILKHTVFLSKFFLFFVFKITGPLDSSNIHAPQLVRNLPLEVSRSPKKKLLSLYRSCHNPWLSSFPLSLELHANKHGKYYNKLQSGPSHLLAEHIPKSYDLVTYIWWQVWVKNYIFKTYKMKSGTYFS